MKTRFQQCVATSAIALAFVAVAVTSAPAVAADCSDQELRSLQVRFSTDDDVYRRGDVIRMRIRVKRVVEGTSLGPAAGVDVTGVVSHAKRIAAGVSVTDENGRARVRFRIPHHMTIGYADAAVYAWREFGDQRCLRGNETGHSFAPDLIRITR